VQIFDALTYVTNWITLYRTVKSFTLQFRLSLLGTAYRIPRTKQEDYLCQGPVQICDAVGSVTTQRARAPKSRCFIWLTFAFITTGPHLPSNLPVRIVAGTPVIRTSFRCFLQSPLENPGASTRVTPRSLPGHFLSITEKNRAPCRPGD
jgi:hypothetical protein